MTLSHINAAWPQDGRETIDDRMELAAPTNTVGNYLAALARARSGDASLPDGFAAYLAQRIPSAHHLADLPKDAIIDRHGRLLNIGSS